MRYRAFTLLLLAVLCRGNALGACQRCPSECESLESSEACQDCLSLCLRERVAEASCDEARGQAPRNGGQKKSIEELEAEKARIDDKCAHVPDDEPNPVEVREKCQSIQQSLIAQIERLKAERQKIAAPTASSKAECDRLTTQYRSDVRAMKRQLKYVSRASSELAEWTKDNTDAQKEALWAGISAVWTHAAEAVHGLRTFSSQLEEWVHRWSKIQKANERPPPTEVIEATKKLTRYFRELEQDIDVRRKLKRIAKGGELTVQAKEAWDLFKQSYEAVRKSGIEAHAELKHLVHEPWVEEARGWPEIKSDFFLTSVDIWSSAGYFAEYSPPVELGRFLVDYGYAATKWYESRERILQQNQISDLNLRALDNLRVQLTKTTCALKSNHCKFNHEPVN